MARLVVFDLDGTLVDSARDIAGAVNAALAALEPGTAPLPLERVVGFVGDGARVLIERVLQHRGSALRPDRVLPLYLEAYRERLLDTTRLYPGVPEALAELAASARPLAVLTNKPGDLSRTILNGLGVGSRFARIWGAGDVPARKPDPAGLRALLAELGAAAEEAWLVGDSPTDVETARAAGVRAAGVAWGFDVNGLRAAAPDRFLDNPRELVLLA
ncbi:MAG TPA: HAD-IA family hydrolase [Vicinamibacteria bacterium]